ICWICLTLLVTVCVGSAFLFKDHIDLAASLQHFPSATKPRRNHKPVTNAQRFGIAIAVTQHRNPLEDFAVLMLGVIHCPLPNRTFPHANAHLPTRTVVLMEHGLLRVTLEHFRWIRTIAFGFAAG